MSVQRRKSFDWKFKFKWKNRKYIRIRNLIIQWIFKWNEIKNLERLKWEKKLNIKIIKITRLQFGRYIEYYNFNSLKNKRINRKGNSIR
jgi:hypothetical protein